MLVKLKSKQTKKMEDSDSPLPPQKQIEVNTNKTEAEKQKVGQLFGVQLSAPKGMKNPLRIFLLLVLANFLLLFLVAKALGLF